MFAVVVLTVIAAALNALGAAGEQRAASRLASLRTPDARAAVSADSRTRRGAQHATWLTSWRHVRRAAQSGYTFAVVLIGTPLWLAGWGADVLGFFGQAAALHLGSLSVVQPLMVTTLLFSLPLGALSTGKRPGRGDWLGAFAICAGLVLLLSTRDAPDTPAVRDVPLAVAMLLVTAGAVAVALWGRGQSPTRQAAMLSIAAGALFSVGAAATKLAAHAYTADGFTGLATSWAAYVLGVASLAGLALQQAGFATGSLPVAMTALVITDPLVSYSLGVIGFGEPVPHSGVALGLAVIGALTLAAGAAALAHSPLLHTHGTADSTADVAAEGTAGVSATGLGATDVATDVGTGGTDTDAKGSALSNPTASYSLQSWSPRGLESLRAPAGQRVTSSTRSALDWRFAPRRVGKTGCRYAVRGADRDGDCDTDRNQCRPWLSRTRGRT